MATEHVLIPKEKYMTLLKTLDDHCRAKKEFDNADNGGLSMGDAGIAASNAKQADSQNKAENTVVNTSDHTRAGDDDDDDDDDDVDDDGSDSLLDTGSDTSPTSELGNHSDTEAGLSSQNLSNSYNKKTKNTSRVARRNGRISNNSIKPTNSGHATIDHAGPPPGILKNAVYRKKLSKRVKNKLLDNEDVKQKSWVRW